MFNSPHFKNRSEGFTILELVIASTILVIGIETAQRLTSYVSKLTAQVKVDNSILTEHQGLSSLVQSIPLSETESISCPQPHPWWKLVSDPYTGTKLCIPCTNATRTQFFNDPKNLSLKHLQSIAFPGCPNTTASYNPTLWNSLSTDYFNLVFQVGTSKTATAGNVGGNLTPPLSVRDSSARYINQIRPKMAVLGCLGCHSGSPSIPGNFNSLGAATSNSAPQLTSFGLGSPLARRLIPPNHRNLIPSPAFTLNFPLRDPQNALPNAPMVRHTIEFSLFPRAVGSIASNRFEFDCRKWTTRNQTGERKVGGYYNCSCPGGLVVDCRSACERNVGGQTKKGVKGCTWYSYYGCIYPPTNNPSQFDINNKELCSHGTLKPGTYLSPINPYTQPTQQNRCANRYPNGTFSLYTREGWKTYPYYYTYWECWDGYSEPGSASFIASELEVTYTITTDWAGRQDNFPTTLRTSGVLK